MRLFDRITTAYGQRIKEDSERLEIEEVGRMVASLQGELSGLKTFIKFVCDVFAIHHIEYNDDQLIEIDELLDSDLNELHDEVKLFEEHDGRWREIQSRVNNLLDEKKNFLFYEAEKTRDLDICHGIRDGLTLYKKICNEIRYEYKHREEDEPLLRAMA